MIQMTNEEKKELDKYKTLLLVTLDYLLKHYVGSMVFDQWDPSVDHYMQEKQKTEQDYQNAHLETLQLRLNNWIRYLRDRIDLNFESYIKYQTGYEVDIFKQLPRNVASIVSRGKLKNDEESQSIALMIKIYQNRSFANENLEMLVDLVDEFAKNKSTSKTIDQEESSKVKYAIVQVAPPLPGIESSIRVETSDTSQVITEEEFAKLQRDNGLLFEQHSPDHQWRRILTWTNSLDENALTEVTIVLKGGSGCIYCAKGSSLPIRAHWKDNSTVVIETEEEYTTHTKYSTVSSYEDIVKIEYIFR
jgi:hypothetical protein